MANFGLSLPYMAQLDVAAGTYSKGFKCGKAISTSITPNTVSAQLYADNNSAEDVTEFSNAAVELGVSTLPATAVPILFGHAIDSESQDETSNTGDSANYVGYAFIVADMLNGKKSYQACFLPKVKFTEGAESFETKGDNITFQTPSLSGTAYGNEDGDWRIKSKKFDTEAEAEEWIKDKLNIA